MSEPNAIPTRSSLRFRLAVSYAGIALLSVAVLGGVMVAVLSQYFRQSEDAYLEAVASRVSRELGQTSHTADELTRAAAILALTSQTRVRVFDAGGVLIADSGLPADVDPETLAPPDGDFGRRERPPGLPSPLGSGVFASGETTDAPRSDRVLRSQVVGPGGQVVGNLLLSDGPASGRDVLASVAQVLGLAALIAMALAASAGYLLSSRIAHPIVELTHATDRMAEGDLSARSGVDGDDEVGRLAASFNAMADRIEATVITLRRFVADAAHEMGTPLTALQADLELADAATEESGESVFVKRALGQARRIEDLSANLLRLSRLEAGELGGTEEVIDLTRLVSEATDATASRADQARIDVVRSISEGALKVRGDAAKLQVVIENLLDNALKFTPEGGSIEVGIEPHDSWALMWVADSGIGIPDVEQDEIFSRFYRARNVAAYPGSGLGLAIVLATVEGYGGTVGFRSSEHGTRFEVRLPLA